MVDGKVSQPLSFRSVKGRFRLIDVHYVEYADGTGFFAVRRPDVQQPFPFSPSLRCFVAKHLDEEMIPVLVVENWMAQLGITGQEGGMFWSAQDFESGYRQGTFGF